MRSQSLTYWSIFQNMFAPRIRVIIAEEIHDPFQNEKGKHSVWIFRLERMDRLALRRLHFPVSRPNHIRDKTSSLQAQNHYWTVMLVSTEYSWTIEPK